MMLILLRCTRVNGQAAGSVEEFRIELFRTFRAQTVAELGFRMIADVGLDLLPISLVVAYFLAGRTDG